LQNRFGDLAEHLVALGIAKRFNKLGYDFDTYVSGGVKMKDLKANEIILQIDLLLENHETIAAVEVKAKPVIKDVENHLQRIQLYSLERQKRGDKQKKIIGVIAGAIFPDNVKK
jgi:hypothetical protein